MMRVAVVGSGVLGAAVADELVRRGLSVIVRTAEESRPPVTDMAFGWLNRYGSAAEPPSGARDQNEIARSLGVLRNITATPPLRGLITWNGAVSWASTAAATVRFAEQSGPGVAPVEAEALRRILPGLRVPPPVVAHASDEGMVEPDDLRRVFLARARAGGASVVAGRVDRIRARRAGGYELLGTGAALVVDRVVLACGTGLPVLAEQLGERIEVPGVPAARFTFSAPELRLDRVVSTPDFEIRPSARHGFVGAEDVVPGETESATRARVCTSLSAVTEAFGLPRVPVLEDMTIGLRPIPAGDGVLCAPLASAPGVVALAAHPGVTLAASLALRTAEQLGGSADSK
ncbi:FAD-binding oxidoreductase [Streptomyces anulatus]|uniref:NAD(P)/FAD-dependent oxidoreductase n=1 Tax=Streptomyces anulatus TaxID=1892 RepID=UPI0022569981|nr:FAD-binding oxidoreductase [Streptomyces anulatus]MCX4516077.1 FAD-binding oxidoreductase [Streptomyces anulatus]MCX4523306.1 FAD-binding oxidoreductase [Streptomyces anulatus]MCX4598904.1 FAD-binding oxidoreductase [Streptomyces anulatus]MCX4606316.1 FAD-binding oxidoreductase [Streptomyces anulatus]